MTRRQQRLTRDGVIVAVALALSVYEVVWGGARPAVLTFLGGLLVSPIIARLDRSQNGRDDRDRTEDDATPPR